MPLRLVNMFEAATQPPRVIKGGVASANIFFPQSPALQILEDFCSLITHGHAVYCMARLEDNGTLAALLRGVGIGKVDFFKVICSY
jgi:purine nucleoside permease